MSSFPKSKRQPPFRAEHIGSFLRPTRLIEMRRRRSRKQCTPNELRDMEDQCITEAIAMQARLGFELVTDGELRRSSWRSGLVDRVDGFSYREAIGDIDLARDEHGHFEHIGLAPFAYSRLVRSRPIVADDCAYVARRSEKVIKATLPAPSYMHFLRGPGCISREAYPNIHDFFDDLVSIYTAELTELASQGIYYVQFDEVALAALCDIRIRNLVIQRGEDPDALVRQYIALVNRVAARRPTRMTLTLHMCRGNFRGKWLAEGGYDYIAESAFPELKVDAFLLEFDSPRAGSFAPLRHIPTDRRVVLGLIGTKTAWNEGHYQLLHRIDEASQFFPLSMMGLSPQCGFASHVAGNPITAADQERKLALVIDIAARVWNC